MRSLLSLTLVASAALGALAADPAELKIDVTQEVECDRKTKSGDGIKVHYKGTFADTGNKFDSSFDRGTPLGFKLGAGRVIKGTLTIPPELGYGYQQRGPIPAGSTLVFETELMGIDGVPKPESIVTKASSAASEASESATANVAEKIAEKVGEAAEVIGTIVADSDDGQEHNEL
ncbi:putative peptidylprolyl isomerase protein [Eutypa lata UCREL1]|uniref:peptidylprolyl isomerase n=1 Tax=Eutypa lata (strain UCR-EL1) TaxID=1287681 RepID=M7T0R4_EUTLA|nr:putative peptidylprolyl isomerase protein [Eutypa lata UCREL1]